ncbi:hypothetical protein [Streptomyces sp. NPDC059010]|uniref:hypothetical protein n=1 Tax=Streptomyces sp. NPDC059010 TaxID=3346695 RepID=UPI0036796F7E
MRKLQQVALVVAAASGLSAIGAGPSVADAPVAYRGVTPPPVGQQDAQAHTWTRSQASVQTPGNQAPPQRMAAPQRGAEVSPQVSPQLSPQINPQLSPQPTSGEGYFSQSNLFRPAQECSPQSLLNANVPIAALAAADARGVDCDQANSQANSAANARATS